ncbi:DUF6249 domain-containing protein [Paraliomyxa miuraensis]|uniref:DUF6249 domain-containing protein n=1 Tax=Paraliomyxa miuraensis TaxID=376150 RepID=UPI0022534302|nr:DUF6249 domain-containing protein [Paraliomyxa miuraensis]MCX4245830.1 DUF6249 domain-containing protein [Paraliomyxa miuraensis]
MTSARIPVSVVGGLAASLLAFLAFVPQAHAAPLGLGGSFGLGTEVMGIVDGFARAIIHGGDMCVDGLSSLGGILGLDPHRAGDSVECHDLRGVGFAFLGLAAVVVIAIGRMRLATEQRRLEVARHLIERGFEPPDGMFTAPARRDLRKGVVLVFAGLGLLVAGMMLGDRGMAAGGLVPAFIGIGYLVSYRLATAEAHEPSRKDARPDPREVR